MSTATTPAADAAIRNPDDPGHYMRIKPTGRRIRLWSGRTLIADSAAARLVLEVGRDLYDPVLYLPAEDVAATLRPSAAERTHCPLKGWASYFDLLDETGAAQRERAAWRYVEPHAFAAELAGLVAFYTEALVVESAPLAPQAPR